MNIIITGAGKGIGFELVKIFLEEGGHTIIAISRKISRLEMLKNIVKEEKTSELYPICYDLLHTDYKKALLPQITAHTEKIDLLINNAAFLKHEEFGSFSTQNFDLTFNTNFRSPFFLIQALLLHFNAPSHIVNITSMGGFQGSSKYPGLAAYSASKAALANLTECLAEELKDRDIRVNALALGAVQTEMLNEAFPGYQAPMKAEQMAAFIARFGKEGHHYFNGKILPVTTSNP